MTNRTKNRHQKQITITFPLFRNELTFADEYDTISAVKLLGVFLCNITEPPALRDQAIRTAGFTADWRLSPDY